MGKTHSSMRTSLQVCHPLQPVYLGNDLEEVRGRTIHDDDAVLSLPILSLPNVVLVPGQTLPLHLFNPATVSLIQRVVNGDKTFGLVTSRITGRCTQGEHQSATPISDNRTLSVEGLLTCASLQGGTTRHCWLTHEAGARLSSVGTTAEIFSIKDETDDATGISTVRVKATGRQRFEIKETRRTVDGNIMAKVRIMAERVLPDFLEGARPTSHERVGVRCSEAETETITGLDLSVGDVAATMKRFIDTTRNKRQRTKRLASAYMTQWPPWVYGQYDVYSVMQLVRDELASWNQTLKQETMPDDPTELSFWVAGNLPLDDHLKLHLLTIDNAIQRLRCELSIMQRCAVLCCRECNLLIANKNDVFSMAQEGPMGAYVNPGGHVHEMITVYKAHNVNLVGRPSTEHSWFPSYAWTILQCRRCASHMGWKFTATDRKLLPGKFWGLCRGSLLPGLQNEDQSKEPWSPTV